MTISIDVTGLFARIKTSSVHAPLEPKPQKYVLIVTNGAYSKQINRSHLRVDD